MGKARVIGYIFVCVNISTEKNLPLCSAKCKVIFGYVDNSTDKHELKNNLSFAENNTTHTTNLEF